MIQLLTDENMTCPVIIVQSLGHDSRQRQEGEQCDGKEEFLFNRICAINLP